MSDGRESRSIEELRQAVDGLSAKALLSCRAPTVQLLNADARPALHLFPSEMGGSTFLIDPGANLAGNGVDAATRRMPTCDLLPEQAQCTIAADDVRAQSVQECLFTPFPQQMNREA